MALETITNILLNVVGITAGIYGGGAFIYNKFRNGIKDEVQRQLQRESEVFQNLKRDLIPLLPSNQITEESIHIESNCYDVFNLKGSSDEAEKTIKINFENPFKNEPKVFLTFTCLDLEHVDTDGLKLNAKRNTRIKMEIVSVNENYFVFKVHTWLNSQVHQARINWIAFGYKK